MTLAVVEVPPVPLPSMLHMHSPTYLPQHTHPVLPVPSPLPGSSSLGCFLYITSFLTLDTAPPLSP